MNILSAAPESIAAIPPPASGLAIARPGRGGPFLLEGERTVVIGNEGAPDGVTIDGVRVVSDLQTGLGSTANLVVYPGLARREVVGPGGVAVETVLAAPTLPFVAVQWSAATDALPVAVRFSVPGAAEGSEPEQSPRGFSVPGRSGGIIKGVMTPTPHDFAIARDEAGRIAVTVHPAQDGPVTLVIAAGEPAEVAAALAASEHLPGHAIRAAGGPLEGGLSISTGVADLDEGLAWARMRVRRALERLARGDADARRQGTGSEPNRAGVLLGLAALVSGDIDGALLTMSEGAITDPAARGLLAARIAATTGLSGYASDCAEKLLAAGLPDRGTRELAFHGLVRSALADGLRHGAPAETVSALRSAITGGTSVLSRSATDGVRALPMVGSPATSDTWARWVDTMLRGDPEGPIPPVQRPDAQGVRASGAQFGVDPDGAWSVWRSALAAGLTEGTSGPGSWDPVGPDSETDAAMAAELILAFGPGLLGLAQDAPAGRIRIAPRLPSHLTEFRVGGITLGDSTVRLEYHRSERRHSFVLKPEIASVPPLAVFEPMVPGDVSRVLVDGAPAELALRKRAASTIVPIQLPIDGDRTVEITTL